MRPYRASKWKIWRQECGFAATAAFALAACACGVSDDAGRLTRASSDYSEVAVVLSAAIERERVEKGLAAVSIALVGFTVYEAEWWHFDHDDWREYGIQNVIFNEITAQP